MTSPVAAAIEHWGALGRLTALLVDAVPRPVRQFIRGPVASFQIGGEMPARTTVRALRPVDLFVGAQSVLERNITIPKGGRADLRHAIELFVRHETPFEAHEVLVHARQVPGSAAAEQHVYAVAVLPRAIVDEFLRARRLARSRVGRIVAIAGNRECDFAPAMTGHRRYLRWLALVPVIVLVVSLYLIASQELEARERAIAALEASLSNTTARIKELNAKLDAEGASSAGTSAALDLVRASPSVFGRLEQARHLLPESAVLNKIDIRGLEIRLSLRSPDVLADVQRLAAAPAHWTSAIEGPVTTDPATGEEMATVLLRASAESAQ